MKKIIIRMNGMMLVMAFIALIFTSCSEDDNRAYERAQIVGVKVDGELFTPAEASDTETKVVIPAGRDLSQAKLQVLVANGELMNFRNDAEYDCRKPLSMSLQGYDGTVVDMRLRIQSAPKLLSFIIKGITVPAEDIHESSSSLIIQVPKNTDLTTLEVTMEFANGTLLDFENGKVKDYSQPCKFTLKGVDEETVYPYELMITTETVGPASINAITVNGVKSDSVVVKDKKIVPYIPSFIDFTSVDVELAVGYGNKIDPAFTGKALNLMTGDNKVKVTGTNGVVTEFVIGVPQLSFKPTIAMKYSELGFGANDLTAVGFSGNYLLAGNYTSATKTPAYYDFKGNKAGSMDATGVNATGYGFRKFATDDKGAILALSLGMSAGEQWIYKWDNVSGKGKEYISFSKASLGVDYSPRSGGINITGSLDGDATIIMTIAQKTDIFIWKVTGGVLNPVPQKAFFPYSGASYYWSVISMPAGMDGYIGFVTNPKIDDAGVICLSNTMSETQRVNGFYATDGKTIRYKNHIYLAYVAYNSTDSKGYMRICDITDGQKSSYQNPIFEQEMPETGANANGTMDADFTVIDGKLHVAFACTNLGLYLYIFDK